MHVPIILPREDAPDQVRRIVPPCILRISRRAATLNVSKSDPTDERRRRNAVAAARPHILVVEDARELLNLFREVLEGEAGYRVTARALPLTDPEELAAVAPDLVLLDLILDGEAAGLTFLAMLKGDERTAAIPVIVCTAATHLLPRAGAQLDDWSCEVIVKPFDLDRLLGAVESCLGQGEGGAIADGS
jgi:CheY-like chemotaxis protein